MSPDGGAKGFSTSAGPKLDARRASLEVLPQRHAIFSIAAMGGGDQEVRRSSFGGVHKIDPMAKT